MALIQNPGPARKLMRFLRLTTPIDSVLAPEMVGVVLVEDLSAPLGDQSRGCMGSLNIGAVAAEFPLIALVRVGAPAAYDLVVSECHFSVSASSQVDIILPTAGLTGLAAGATSFTDFEIPGQPTSQLGGDTQVAVPAGRILWGGLVLANTIYRVPLNLRIGTVGDGVGLSSVFVVGRAVNTKLRAGFTWDESAPQG